MNENIDIKTIVRNKSPRPLWERWGYFVKPVGDELRIYNDDGDCEYRSVKQVDGHWVSSKSDAGIPIAPRVGDNISLFQFFEHEFSKRPVSYAQAISKIAFFCKEESANAPFVRERYESKAPDGITLPLATIAGDMKGTAYLQSRGISKEIIEQAKKTGLIQFVDGSENYAPAVFFVSHNELGLPVFANKRCMSEPRESDHGMTKRDVYMSNKTFVPIFQGDPMTVFFTEGGVNMLSVLELYKRASKELPTVIMTGGQGNLKWGNNPRIIEILQKAENIYFMGENDFHLSEQKQEQNRIHKYNQCNLANEIQDCCEARIVDIPDEYGDINDMLLTSQGMTQNLCDILNDIEDRQSESITMKP